MKSFLLTLVLVAAPTVFVGGMNTWLLMHGTALDFQRFGSFVVFLAIVALGLAKSVFRDDPFDRREAAATEFFFLALGTIQWGYGDLFYCWLHGFGWRSC